MYGEYPGMIFEKKDRAAYIIFNDPKKKNPLSEEMSENIGNFVAHAEADDDVRVIVLRGAEGNFCSGADVGIIKERVEKFGTSYDVRPTIELMTGIAKTIRECRKPVISWVEGVCAGGGLSFALASDFIFCEETSKFVFAFVNMAIIPDTLSAHMLLRSVGRMRATDLLMSGRLFSGKEAESIGMVTKALPADELEAYVLKQIKHYANGPSLAYAQMKELINRSIHSRLEEDRGNEAELQYPCCQSYDHGEAANAFLNKRPPKFEGR
jgi:2-(1,2-epoxy-1,2-dihydrophenyl)acetyl-CoA isomerase